MCLHVLHVHVPTDGSSVNCRVRVGVSGRLIDFTKSVILGVFHLLVGSIGWQKHCAVLDTALLCAPLSL